MSAPIDAIYSLPNELLEAIAAAGQEERTQGYPFNTVTFKMEWALSHVSRRFRDVILGAPALWTLLETDFGDEGSVEILKLYLERSEPQKVSADLRCRSTESRRDLIVERVGLIVPHINRIWRLSIDVYTNSMELLIPFRDVAGPALRRLDIVNNHPGPWAPIEIFSAAAPALTFLKMDGFKPLLPVPPWTASLTHLEFWNGQDLGDESATLLLTSITEQCPLLVHLYLDINWMDSNGHRFHIPSLITLHISISHSEDSDYLLGVVDLFDTPALTKLIINNARCDQIQELFIATSLPHVSFPALTSLSLVNSGLCPCEDAVPFSDPLIFPKIFPALSSLTLVNQCFIPTLVGNVLGPTSQWPLKIITLCPQNSFLDDVLAAVRDGIRLKRQLGHTIPTLRFSPALFSLVPDDWDADGTEVRIFDPAQIITSLDRRARETLWSSRTEDIY
ncbi:hypothetical protein MSAN_01486400 [Mycena sanguinolenta]|uniref:F-box domain-containing protein n=1 Tax=Mycena sanguinolenta TaxID=230812 RepID=A0A8H6YC68_9AGAR|nr:hypothetical protein MSAN_01486400 [Mycena sanguinolenta]